MTLTLNIVPQHNEAGVFDALKRLNAPLALVQDEHKRALQLRSLGYQVIYRQYRPDDARLHETMSPQQWIDEHRAYAGSGIAVQVLNEPVVTTVGSARRLAAWLLEVIRLANAIGMRLCLPNFAMGNPHEDLIARGAFDELLRNLGNHVLGLHEYAQRGDVSEGWLIGRYRLWLKRARDIGAPRPQITITESGWDIGGGHGDGHRNHISAEAYGVLLKRIAAIYAIDGVTACVFCYGNGFNWQSFNIEGEAAILDAMVEANATAPATAITAGDTVLLTPAPNGTRLRATPSVEGAIKDVLKGAPMEARVNEISVQADGVWYSLTLDGLDPKRGWVRADAATFARVDKPSEPTEPLPLPIVYVQLPETGFASKQEALRFADALTAYADAIRVFVNR